MSLVPEFLKKNTDPMPDTVEQKAQQDRVGRARSGANAIEELIAERDKAVMAANVLQRHYDANKASIDCLEYHVSELEGKLAYYINLSTSLVTKLNTVGLVVDDAIREARESAMSGRQMAEVRPAPQPPMKSPDQEQLEGIIKNFSPDPNPEPVK